MKRFATIFLLISLMGASLYACGKGCNKGYGMNGPGDRFVGQVFKALSYLDIKADDLADIKMSAKIYKKDMYKIRMDKQFPIEAFGDEELDEKKFLAHCATEQKKMALAKYDFLDAVYTVLSKEQKAQFLKEMKSVVNMKKFGSGNMMGAGACGGKPGMGMGPNACDGKGPKR